jgi:exopolysaccharide biosynthesis polyprenyl glycosylphosphotransferase
MNTCRRQILLAAIKLFDVIVMIACFTMAALMVAYQIHNSSFDQFFYMRIKVENVLWFLGLILFWHTLHSMFGLYDSKRFSSLKTEIKDLMKATILGTSAILILARIFKFDMITPVFIGIFWIGTSSVIVFSRILLRVLLRKVRIYGRNLRHVLVIGTNPRAVSFARKLESRPELGYQLIGFVENGWSGNPEFKKAGYTTVTNFDEFHVYIRKNVVDEVMLCLPVKSYYDEISMLINQCEEQGIIVRHLPDLFDVRLARCETEYFEGIPIISHCTGAMGGWQVLVKNMLDIIISLILLVILFPLFVLTAILIKATSHGSVFFVQKRVGLNKRIFKLYKFRTMVHNAEQKITELKHLNEVDGPAFKIENDPRVTPIGKFLRKTSIDELPQLINVLKGDMSLVGPRPLPVRDYNGFELDWHRRRFSVRPGITCLWQVSGRNNIPFEKWMELDMLYIDSWSLWLDIKILTKTIPAAMTGIGAS